MDKAKLKQYFDRLVALDEERKSISDDFRDVLAEAKEDGYDAKILRKTVMRRKKTKAELEAEETMIDTYETAVEAAANA
jgi:uncharacterized protein (UPF0335 family)